MKGPIPRRGESRFARARCFKRFRPKIPAGLYWNTRAAIFKRRTPTPQYATPANICRLLLVLFARARAYPDERI